MEREVIKDGKRGGAPEESEARLVWPRRTVSSRDPLMPYPHVLICLCGGPLKAWDTPPSRPFLEVKWTVVSDPASHVAQW